MAIKIVQKPIADMKCDVMVNPAGYYLEPEYGVSGDIFQKAGFGKLRDACGNLSFIETGCVTLTPSFNLSSKYIIHAAVPLYSDGKSGEAELLQRCYNKSLDLAIACDCYDICFPLMCAGKHQFPTKKAWEIALATVEEYIGNKNFNIDATFCVLTKESYDIGVKLLKENLDIENTAYDDARFDINHFITYDFEDNKYAYMNKHYFNNSGVLKYDILDMRKCIEAFRKVGKNKVMNLSNSRYPDYPKEVWDATRMTDIDQDYMEHVEYFRDLPYTELNYKQIETAITYIKRADYWINGSIVNYIEDYSLLKLYLRLEELWKIENNKINGYKKNMQTFNEMYYGGCRFDYTFFWKCGKSDKLDNGCLSPWYPCKFTENNVEYNSLEQYIMAKKAETCKDYETRHKIMKETNPKKIRCLGNDIKESEHWNFIKEFKVEQGNILKFYQNDDLERFLINTKNNIILKTSPNDCYWGIGLDINDKNIKNPRYWKGSNRLGFILMEVRERIKNNRCF